MLTTFDLDEYVFDALRAGASGFLLKDATEEELVAAVRVVAAGDALLAPGVTRRLIADYARRPARTRGAGAVLDRLTAARVGDPRAGRPRHEQRRDRRLPGASPSRPSRRT